MNSGNKRQLKFGILRTLQHSKTDENWVRSCEELGIPYKMIDIWGSEWIEEVKESGCDGFLVRPPYDFQERKTGYDERLWFISKIMGFPIYPSYEECFLYENKRAVTYWLSANGFPGIPTKIFFRKEDALKYLDSAEYPLIIKSNVGSAAKGVKIIKSPQKARRIANSAFGMFSEHLAIGWMPKRQKFSLISYPWVGASQRHTLFVQPFLNIKWEWRISKVGDSYFGKQKLLKGNFASGSLRFGWVEPPRNLLDLVRKICDKGNFTSMAIDILETVDGRFYVNEMQSLFGSHHPSQMIINDKPGRYLWNGSDYVFEEGCFNRHGSYLLRVEKFVQILSFKN